MFRKVIILGCPGSGKSTLAKKLHEQTGMPLYHLDSIWWKPDRTHITRQQFDSRLHEIMQGEKWIIDGDYSRTYETRFLSCDTVIFLDYSTEECMKGIRERTGKNRDDGRRRIQAFQTAQAKRETPSQGRANPSDGI